MPRRSAPTYALYVRGPSTRYARWAARHHLHHHFVTPRKNHGVTTPVWDWIFGTYQKATIVPVRSRELAGVPWLQRAFAAATPPDHLADYELR